MVLKLKQIKYVFFTILLLAIGFYAERGWQFWQAKFDRPIIKVDESKNLSILYIGSSISYSGQAPEQLRNAIERLHSGKQVAVYPIISLNLGEVKLNRAIKYGIFKYKPQIILLQFGINPANPDELLSEGKYKYQKWKKIILENFFLKDEDILSDASYLNDLDQVEALKMLQNQILNTNINSIYRGWPDSETNLLLILKNKLHAEQYAKIKIWQEERIKTLFEKNLSTEEERKIFELSCSIGAIISGQTRVQRENFTIEEQRTAIKNLEKFIIEGVRSIEQNGTDTFLSKGPQNELYQRYWLAGTWKSRKNVSQKDPEKYFSEEYNLAIFIPLLINEKYSSINLAPPDLGNTPISNAILKLLRIAIDRIERIKSKKEDFLIETLSESKKVAEANGARLLFFQYPNGSNLLLSKVAEKLEIPVLGSNNLFDPLIERDGYDAYFTDRVEDTGHMTNLGGMIYANNIAEQLAKFIAH